MSLKEHQELEEMKKGISYDPIQKRVLFKYPYNEKVSLMKNNYHQAEKRAIAQEKSLVKKGILEKYNEVVDDYITRGVWVEVDKGELDEWEAQGHPIHFLAHHAVVNEASKSTKVRIG